MWTSTEHWNELAIRLFHKGGFRKRGRIEGLDNERPEELFFRRAAQPHQGVGAHG